MGGESSSLELVTRTFARCSVRSFNVDCIRASQGTENTPRFCTPHHGDVILGKRAGRSHRSPFCTSSLSGCSQPVREFLHLKVAERDARASPRSSQQHRFSGQVLGRQSIAIGDCDLRLGPAEVFSYLPPVNQAGSPWRIRHVRLGAGKDVSDAPSFFTPCQEFSGAPGSP